MYSHLQPPENPELTFHCRACCDEFVTDCYSSGFGEDEEADCPQCGKPGYLGDFHPGQCQGCDKELWERSDIAHVGDGREDLWCPDCWDEGHE